MPPCSSLPVLEPVLTLRAVSPLALPIAEGVTLLSPGDAPSHLGQQSSPHMSQSSWSESGSYNKNIWKQQQKGGQGSRLNIPLLTTTWRCGWFYLLFLPLTLQLSCSRAQQQHPEKGGAEGPSCWSLLAAGTMCSHSRCHLPPKKALQHPPPAPRGQARVTREGPWGHLHPTQPQGVKPRSPVVPLCVYPVTKLVLCPSQAMPFLQVLAEWS